MNEIKPCYIYISMFGIKTRYYKETPGGIAIANEPEDFNIGKYNVISEDSFYHDHSLDEDECLIRSYIKLEKNYLNDIENLKLKINQKYDIIKQLKLDMDYDRLKEEYPEEFI